MQINVILPRAPGTWTTRWKPRGAIRSFTRSCYWPTKSKITIKCSKSDTVKETLINRWAFFKWVVEILMMPRSLSLWSFVSGGHVWTHRLQSYTLWYYQQPALRPHCGRHCNDRPADTTAMRLLKNNSSVSLAGTAEKYGLKNYSQISWRQWSPSVPCWWVKKLLKITFTFHYKHCVGNNIRWKEKVYFMLLWANTKFLTGMQKHWNAIYSPLKIFNLLPHKTLRCPMKHHVPSQNFCILLQSFAFTQIFTFPSILMQKFCFP